MTFLDKFKKKKQDAIPNEEVENSNEEENRRYEDFINNNEENAGASSEEPKDDDISFDTYRNGEDYDNPFAGMEQKIDTEPVKEQSRTGRRLKGGLVAGIVAAIAMVTVGYTAYNFLKPKDTSPAIKTTNLQEKNTVSGNTNALSGTSGNGENLPTSYSELAKYEAVQKQRQREELIRSGKLNPAREQMEKVKAENEKKYGKSSAVASVTPPTPPSRPSLPQSQESGMQGGNYGYGGGGRLQVPQGNPYQAYNTPVGFTVTESGKVASSNTNAIFKALPGTAQATGKKYILNSGTVIPATMLTGLSSDSESANATAQVRQDVYDSLTGTHLLIPQGSKLIGRSNGGSGRRMGVTFSRIILPNGASIQLPAARATDSQGYTGLRDKYDEKWGPTIKGAVLAGIFTGIADWVGDIDTKETSGGGLIRSAWGDVAERISDRIGDKADSLDRNEKPEIKIRPGFQFHVYLTDDINLYQYKPLKEEPR